MHFERLWRIFHGPAGRPSWALGCTESLRSVGVGRAVKTVKTGARVHFPLPRKVRSDLCFLRLCLTALVWIDVASDRPIPLPDNPGSGSSGHLIGFSRNPSAAPHFQPASALAREY